MDLNVIRTAAGTYRADLINDNVLIERHENLSRIETVMFVRQLCDPLSLSLYVYRPRRVNLPAEIMADFKNA